MTAAIIAPIAAPKNPPCIPERAISVDSPQTDAPTTKPPANPTIPTPVFILSKTITILNE